MMKPDTCMGRVGIAGSQETLGAGEGAVEIARWGALLQVLRI